MTLAYQYVRVVIYPTFEFTAAGLQVRGVKSTGESGKLLALNVIRGLESKLKYISLNRRDLFGPVLHGEMFLHIHQSSLVM